MSIHMIKFLGIISAVLLINGCQSTPKHPVNQITCSEPRPEVCTLHFQRVCGFNSDNSSKTYPNACSACSNKEVVNYIKSECPG